MIEIVYAAQHDIPSFYETLDAVAREEVHLERVTAGPYESILAYQVALIKKNNPSYFAIHNSRVVGWADIMPGQNERLAHRGTLGMGVLKAYRGRGLGTKLLESALEHAKISGLEKVELTVSVANPAAIALYKKFGFKEYGYIKNFRKLHGRYMDCSLMEIFL